MLPVSQIEMILNQSNNLKTFENHIKSLIDTDKITQFLERFNDYIQDYIPLKNIENIILTMNYFVMFL